MDFNFYYNTNLVLKFSLVYCTRFIATLLFCYLKFCCIDFHYIHRIYCINFVVLILSYNMSHVYINFEKLIRWGFNL